MCATSRNVPAAISPTRKMQTAHAMTALIIRFLLRRLRAALETGLFPPYPGYCPFGWGLRPLLYDLCPRLPIYSYLPCIRTSETAVAHITAFVIRGDAVRNEDTLCESGALSQLHSLSLPGIIGHLNEHMAFIV